MSDWQIRRELFYRLNADREFDDDLGDKDVQIVEDTVGYAIKYFQTADIGWVYPAKSYMVAICYARWLEEEFGEEFYAMLDHPDLLAGNDPYFVPYSADKDTYDQILAVVGRDFPMEGVVPDARKYFEEEFMLNEQL